MLNGTFALRAGQLRLKSTGFPSPGRNAYGRLLQQRLGVKLEVVAGCAVDVAIAIKVEGYNQRMRAAIEWRFGPQALADVWDAVDDEAQS